MGKAMGKVPTPTPPSAMLPTGFDLKKKSVPHTQNRHTAFARPGEHDIDAPEGPFLQAQLFCHSWPSDPAGPELIGTRSPRSEQRLCLRLCAADLPCLADAVPAVAWAAVKQQPRSLVGSAGRGQRVWTTSYPQYAIANVIPPCRFVHHCLVSGFFPLPSVSVSQFAAMPVRPPVQASAQFAKGDPLIADTSLALPITQRCSLPQIGPPRDSTGDETHRPARSNSARFPAARQVHRTRRKGSSMFPPLAGRPLHVRTEVPPRSISIAISCPPGSPGNKHFARPMFCGD